MLSKIELLYVKKCLELSSLKEFAEEANEEKINDKILEASEDIFISEKRCFPFVRRYFKLLKNVRTRLRKSKSLVEDSEINSQGDLINAMLLVVADAELNNK